MKRYIIFIILLISILSCHKKQHPKTLDNHYPKFIIDNKLEAYFSKIKWSYYKYYQNCHVSKIKVIENKKDTLLSIPLFCYDVKEVFKKNSAEYSISFYINSPVKSKVNFYFMPEYDCFNKLMGSPLYNFFINRKNYGIYKIEYIEQRFIEDTTWINEILYSPDESFVEKLLEHQDSITPWLKNELILRGYIEK